VRKRSADLSLKTGSEQKNLINIKNTLSSLLEKHEKLSAVKNQEKA